MNIAATKSHCERPLMPDDFPKVYYGAAYRQLHPYQTLLYRAVGPTVTSAPCSPSDALTIQKEMDRSAIYHLHWEEHIFRTTEKPKWRAASSQMLRDLENFRAAGGHIVWSRHNAMPHDKTMVDTHAEIVPFLSELASAIHVHSWDAVECLQAREDIDINKFVVIGHGNYVGHYRQWPRPRSRQRLKLDDDNHVFLVFGQLADHKALAQIIEVFAKISEPNARLIFAGTKRSEAPKNANDDPRISIIDEFIPDAEVGLYFSAADTVLMNYPTTLSSGVAVLAAGFGRGILGTDVAGLRDIVRPDVNGALINSNEKGGLERMMTKALREGIDVWARRGEQAAHSARARDWSSIGRQWRDLYFSLTMRPRYRLQDSAKIVTL